MSHRPGNVAISKQLEWDDRNGSFGGKLRTEQSLLSNKHTQVWVRSWPTIS